VRRLYKSFGVKGLTQEGGSQSASDSSEIAVSSQALLFSSKGMLSHKNLLLHRKLFRRKKSCQKSPIRHKKCNVTNSVFRKQFTAPSQGLLLVTKTDHIILQLPLRITGSKPCKRNGALTHRRGTAGT
jgi:hypothetical protein